MRAISIAAAICLATASSSLAQTPSTADPLASGPEPVFETGELMLLVIKPAYDELQRAMAAPPADRQQWAQLYQKAARLAEFENLILFRAHERSEKPEWKALAASARKATIGLAAGSLKALGNISDAKFADLRKPYEAVSAGCNSCHRAMSREAPTIKP
jgi:hypothetical protein